MLKCKKTVDMHCLYGIIAKMKKRNLVSLFGGRFATVNINNSAARPQSVCARFINETPQYVDLQLVNEGGQLRRYKKSSIRGAHSGTASL